MLTKGYLHKKSDTLLLDGTAGKEFIKILITNKEFSKLARLWTEGIEVDWNLLYETGEKPRRISLPTYPFTRERYWILNETTIINKIETHDTDKIFEGDASGDIEKDHLTLETKVLNYLSALISDLLKIPREKLLINSNLAEYGFNSLMAIRLINQIKDISGKNIEVETLYKSVESIFNNPSIKELSRFLIEENIIQDHINAITDSSSFKSDGKELEIETQKKDHSDIKENLISNTKPSEIIFWSLEENIITPSQAFKLDEKNSAISDTSAQEYAIEIYQKIADKEIPWEEASQILEQFHLKKNIGGDIKETYPLSAGQEALWIIHQFAPENYAYNLPTALWINRETDMSVLKRACQRVYDAHPSLRVVIQLEDGKPVQKIKESSEVCYEICDLSTIDDAGLERILSEEARKPFNLETGPLMRITVFVRSEGDHIFLLNVHHIIFDGISFGVFLKDLNECYLSELHGIRHDFPVRKSSYADFVDWQTNMLKSDIGQQHKNYWIKQLSGNLQILDLPLDKPRPANPTYNGSTCTIEVDETLTKQIREIAYSNHTTNFSMMLAALKVLLFKYSHQNDILIGTAVAGRPEPRFDNIIGYFMNMVCIRTNLSGDPTFKQFLEQTNNIVIRALDYYSYPFYTLTKELDAVSKGKGLQIIQVGFYSHNWTIDLQRSPVKTGETGPKHEFLISDNYPNIHQEGEFDLTVEVFELGTAMSINFKYNTDIFERATIRRMSEYYAQLLREIVTNPEKRISEIRILTPEDERQLLVEFNNTQADYPMTQCMHELFEEQADRTPEAVAVVFNDTEISYGELNAKSSLLAGYLRQKGVKQGSLVGIFMKRSADLLIGLLGILKAGGAYVPIDPIYPPERIEYMIQDTDLPYIITQSDVENNLPESRVKKIRLDRNWEKTISRKMEKASQKFEPAFGSRVSPEDLAYVIFTSGSTGKPKGVQIPHRALTNLLCSMAHCPGCGSEDRLLALTTICFDIAGLELFLPLITGATVEILPEDIVHDGVKLLEKIEHGSATIIQATPATWHMLINAGWNGSKSLKILCGGEALSRELAQKLLQRGGEVWNVYGPTETTIWSAVWKVEPGEKIFIGRPIANTQLYVLDSHLHPMPCGVSGELYIGGDGLARGYLNKPDQTNERFIANPFSQSDSDKIYKTGDLVRYMPDGSVEYLGRIDSQVKIRGYRIELGEIEAVLSEYPSVKDAVVAAVGEQPDHKQLVAYIVPTEEHELSTSDIRSFLSGKLPGYMVPTAFVMMEAMPLTPNGKVDRRSLPMPDESRADLSVDFVAPRNTTELQLVQIWEELLSIHPVGVKDNFFNLGGNSLLAVSLMTRIQKQLGKNLPVKILVEYPTIAQLGQIININKAAEPYSPLVFMQKNGAGMPFFCISPADGTVFRFAELAHQLGNDQPFYGLQAYGLEPGTIPLQRYPEMAEKYIEAIKTVAPHGPYIIGGFCLGGALAYEIAQQLQRQGEDIALLVLFDALATPVYHYFTEDSDIQHFVGFTRDFGGSNNIDLVSQYLKKRNIEVLQDADKEAAAYKDAAMLSKEERLGILWECVLEAGVLLPDVGIEYLSRTVDVYTASFSAAMKYMPESYLGHRILLLRAEEGMRTHIDDPSLHWRPYAHGAIEVVDVPGNHFSMLSLPHVQAVVNTLNKYITKAQEDILKN